MIKGALVGSGMIEDRIFDMANENNRDGCFEPFLKLKNTANSYGIRIHTPDVVGDEIDFEIHMNVQRKRLSDKPAYLLLFETPAVRPKNAKIPKYYRKIFTWRDDLVDGERFIKFNFPNPLHIPKIDGFANRDRFCCIIAGNKINAGFDRNELYTARLSAIRWFEANAPLDFDLYGVGWDKPPVIKGMVAKLVQRLQYKNASNTPFPSYRGKVDQKLSVLQKTRFSICYENVCETPGYITEKIFDCFFAGCVPVYWGASNIKDHIPSECYIDRRDFEDMNQVHSFLKSMSEETYRSYQTEIVDFLKSEAYKPFGSESFANVITREISADLGIKTSGL